MDTNYIIKDAVYTALTGAAFYYVAKVLNADTNAALIIGTAVGQILATNSKNKQDAQKLFSE